MERENSNPVTLTLKYMSLSFKPLFMVFVHHFTVVVIMF